MSVSTLTHVTVSPGELDVLRYILGFPQHGITTELSHRRIPECCCQSDDSVLICGDVEFVLTFPGFECVATFDRSFKKSPLDGLK